MRSGKDCLAIQHEGVVEGDDSNVDERDTPLPAGGWQEADSELFLDRGRIYTPRRDEIANVLLDLVPAEPAEPFLGVDIGAGHGWLSEAVLARFPQSRMLALDGSATMLDAARQRLAPFGERVEFRGFRLEDDAWIVALPSGIRCFLSSLVIHHLDGDGKRALFGRLLERLEPGGALLVADIAEPTSEWGRRHMARAWDEEVQRQSHEFTGSLDVYDRFVGDRWNAFTYPDTSGVDRPSTLPDQLRWLDEAGYHGVDAFWARAGHAVFGGYQPAPTS